MSFGGPWNGGQWHAPNGGSWRSYAPHQGGGPMRAPSSSRTGWTSWMSDPYFSRSSHAQNHMINYERNRMHLFNQPTPWHEPKVAKRDPLLETPINDYARQTLIKNAHVPGLRTGLQMRRAMQQKMKVREQIRQERQTVKSLRANISVFSERIEVRWESPEPKRALKYMVTIDHVRTRKLSTIERTTLFCDIPVIAGDSYKVGIECYCQKEGHLVANWSREVRAEFSYTELKQLLQKCYHFVSRGAASEAKMHEFCVVYRCKPKVYWDEIHHYCNDVMQKYIKDDNGQPGNLINGKINGLFFSARLLPDLTLPQMSPFGNVRMIVNAFVILNPERHNFYFADFYCNKNIHYVTVVICVVESDTDRYCRDRLIKLNPLSNPFVKLVPPVDRYGQWRFFINYTLWVELYYTEDIQLNMGQFSAIMATGAGTSKIGGLPNNKHCNLCNLYPLGKKVQHEPLQLSLDQNSVDSTMATILRENERADPEVLDTLCYLVDRVEEQCLDSEELVEKLDVELVAAVEKMNKAVARTKAESFFGGIAKNLSDFVTGFNRRRDALIKEVKQLRNQSD